MTVGILKLGQWCVSRLCVEGDKVWQFGGQYRMDVPTTVVVTLQPLEWLLLGSLTFQTA